MISKFRNFQKKLTQNPRKKEGIKFLLLVPLCYLIWKIISYFLENIEPQWWIDFQNFVGAKTVLTSALFLQNILGYELHYNARNLLLKDTLGIYVADHCLGIPSMVVFCLFILFFKGKWKHKSWFIPLGILGVFLINTTRVIGLGILQKSASDYFWQFNHTYTFLILAYGFIFLMIKWWMDKVCKWA